MRLTLEPVKRRTGNPRAYIVRDESGADRGVVRRKTRHYSLRGKGLHTLFPCTLFPGTRHERIGHFPGKVFATLAEVRQFISDRPERYWA
jgi:hypothetical protein